VRRGVLLAAVVFAVIGCQQAPPPPSAPPKSPAVVLREEGDALAARGDYTGAAAKYEAALASTPDDVTLRFALGSAYSYLNRRADAINQFKIVVAKATPTSQEYQLARQWLVSVGALRPDEAPAGAPTTGDTQTVATPQAPQHSLSGTLEWKGLTPGQRRIPVRLTLTGEDTENRSVKSVRMARLSEKYFFNNIPPGSYRLVALALEPREQPLWDVRVMVEKDKPTVFDLQSSQAAVSPDAFPGAE
jgi:tetratricopeptide (TPR) repeat protein